MNVDPTRATDSTASDSASSRSATKSSGFPALMASILDSGSPAAKSPSDRTEATRERAAGDAAADHAARGDQGDASERGPRDPQARDAREARDARGARNLRDVRNDRMAGRKRAAEDADADAADAAAGGAAAEAAPRTEVSEDEDAPSPKSAAEEVDPSQVLPSAEPATWEVAAALALPELVARLSGLAADSGAAADDEPLDDAALGSGDSVEAAAGGSADEAGVGEAAIPDAPLLDTGARDAAIGLVEAAKQGAAATDPDPKSEATPDAAVATAAEAPPEHPHVETGREVEATPRFESRPSSALEAARRDALEGSTVATSEIAVRAGAGAGAESGSGDASQEQPKPAPTRGAEGGERSGVEAGAALGAAAAAVTTGAGDAVARSAESSAAGGPDALGATTPGAPASETDATLPPERIQAGRGAEAITVQADWLASRGGGTARLVLNPPELGELVIRVSVRQQNVDVMVVAQTALGHSMAQDQGDRLAQAFAHRDLRLDQFEVRRADPSDANAGAGQFGSSDAGQRERERAEDRETGFDYAAGRGGRRRTGGAGEAPSTPLRGAAGARAAGIDLRI